MRAHKETQTRTYKAHLSALNFMQQGTFFHVSKTEEE